MARGLGVVGTVRNRPDGSVEVHVFGSAAELEIFENRLWEGSPSARVDGVEVFESEAALPEDQFEVC
jgi:acylphosphatase